ncbi:DUF427 domain-containing protein [Sneathiella limimaris]|uniref:DUF427 domain-containing protein n=1 Tax=Sneathiella limimaris TaxID=1964213 RepID=UPI00146AE250|nr:DUF427 domain-containing protein [Sneathiella limimaris]
MNRNKSAPGFQKRPQHEISISRSDHRWNLFFGVQLVASSENVIALSEGGYPARYYFPRTDVNFKYLKSNQNRTYCPFKGTARYWDIIVEDESLSDAVWAYDDPFMECIDIKEHLSFFIEKEPLKIASI